jgi:hypothetical protein
MFPLKRSNGYPLVADKISILADYKYADMVQENQKFGTEIFYQPQSVFYSHRERHFIEPQRTQEFS